jgi:Protein of unknown function DUF262.
MNQTDSLILINSINISNSTKPKIKIETLKSVLDIKELNIPSYQRPYRWKAEKHVKQLFDDIYRECEKDTKEYRIGTIILHNNLDNNKHEIVDGQQRLVTISLILQALEVAMGTGKEKVNNPLLSVGFNHLDSRNNIKYNFIYIERYINLLPDKEKFKSFLLDRCTFVVITLNNISEAFQMFDSQNARGKSLNASDLLKAYHLREMEENTLEEKKICVERWEENIDNELLNLVLEEYLFRIRNWKKGKRKYFFSKNEIDEFKGINIIRSIREGKKYPFLTTVWQKSMNLNFQIEEPIVNGKRFFDYVDHYIHVFEKIKKNCEQKENQDLFDYQGIYRIGDQRIVNLYRCILICYYDKFGEDECFKDFAFEIYRWAFIYRLTKQQIRYETILNMLLNNPEFNPIELLDSWYTPDILFLRMQIPLLSNITIEKKNVDELKKIIEEIEKKTIKNK